MSTWWGDSKNMKKIEFSWWLFEGRLRQGKNVLPDGLNWLCYFAGSSKSHHENSISFIFLESPHQVDMKNIVKSSKHFFGYFNALETHSGYQSNIFLLISSISKLLCICLRNLDDTQRPWLSLRSCNKKWTTLRYYSFTFLNPLNHCIQLLF